MKLTELILDEAVKSFSLNDFPLIINNVDKYHVKWFTQSLNKLNTALKEGELNATEFKDIKDGLNRALADAYSNVIRTKYYHAGNYKNIPDNLQFIDDLNPEIHRATGALKKLEKVKDSKESLVKDSLAFFRQNKDLVEAVQSLKDKIVKKKRAAIEKETAKAKKKETIMSHKDVKRVQKVLIDITTEVRNDVMKGNENWINNIIEQYKNQYDPENRETQYLRKYAQDPFSRSIISKVITYENRKELVKKNYKKILKSEAKKMTDEVLDMFINKNTTKMGEILKNKNNLKEIKLINADASRGVIEGLMEFTFKDKSSFNVNNKVVTAYSKYGRPFYRFPTTFHKVILADGSKMKTPSEQKMKKYF